MNVPFHMTPAGRDLSRTVNRMGLLGLPVLAGVAVLEFVWGFWYLTILFALLIGFNIWLTIWRVRRLRQREEEWRQTTLQEGIQEVEDAANGLFPL